MTKEKQDLRANNHRPLKGLSPRKGRKIRLTDDCWGSLDSKAKAIDPKWSRGDYLEWVAGVFGN